VIYCGHLFQLKILFSCLALDHDYHDDFSFSKLSFDICGKVEINPSGLVGKTVHECILNMSFGI